MTSFVDTDGSKIAMSEFWKQPPIHPLAREWSELSYLSWTVCWLRESHPSIMGVVVKILKTTFVPNELKLLGWGVAIGAGFKYAFVQKMQCIWPLLNLLSASGLQIPHRIMHCYQSVQLYIPRSTWVLLGVDSGTSAVRDRNGDITPWRSLTDGASQLLPKVAKLTEGCIEEEEVEMQKKAVFTSSVTDSVRGEKADGVTRDEGIALAISEEQGATDGFSQPTESVAEEVNTAQKNNDLQEIFNVPISQEQYGQFRDKMLSVRQDGELLYANYSLETYVGLEKCDCKTILSYPTKEERQLHANIATYDAIVNLYVSRFLEKNREFNHEKYLPSLRTVALAIAIKISCDPSIWNVDFADFISPYMGVEKHNKMEFEFLRAIDWNLSTYALLLRFGTEN